MEVSRELIIRLRKGFAGRAELLRETLRHSGAASPIGRSAAGLRQDGQRFDLRAFSGRFLSYNLTYSEYIDSLTPILPMQYKDMMLSYYFSGSLISDAETLIISQQYFNDLQFSVVVQTLALSGKLKNPAVVEEVHKGVRRLVRQLRIRSGQSVDLNALHARISKHGIGSPEKLNSLKRIRSFFSLSKEALIHALGPDLFSLIGIAIDPSYDPSGSDLSYIAAISDAFQCQMLLRELMIFRQSRALPRDNLLAQAVPGIEVPLSPLHERRPKSSLSTILEMLAAIETASDGDNARALAQSILRLHSYDQTAVVWLNWSAIYRCIDRSPRLADFEMSTVHLLMGLPFMVRHFPLVNMAVGDGAFESSLRAAVRKLRDKSLSTLVQGVAKVPEGSRRTLIDALLRHDAALVLCALLQYDPPWAKKLIQAQSLSFDARATAFRHDAAKAFLAGDLIPKQYAEAIQNDAISALRVAYLRGRQLQGLVHLQLSRAQELLSSTLTDSLHFVRRMLDMSELEDPDTYMDNVADVLSSWFTDYVLISGPDDVKTTVSDSLRHGQLPNRFLQAFDKALTLTVPSITDTTRFWTDLENAPGSLGWLLTMRQSLVVAIKQFNETSLSVHEDGALYGDVKTKMYEYILGLLKVARMEGAMRLESSDWQPQVQGAVDKFLSIARKKLNSKIEGYQKQIARIPQTPDGETQATTKKINRANFQEALGQQLGDALGDATRWMALATEERLPFSLNDVVQLCLITHSPTSGQPLAIGSRMSEMRGDTPVVLQKERLISGEYFEFIETLCKNLIGNYFSHSGLGRDVRATIELTLADDELIIRSSNTVSSARYKALQGTLSKLQSSVSLPNLAQAAEDKSSGLIKMIWACNRAFGVKPDMRLTLDAPPFSFNITFVISTGGVPIIVE